jgi:hypothetical protein
LNSTSSTIPPRAGGTRPRLQFYPQMLQKCHDVPFSDG